MSSNKKNQHSSLEILVANRINACLMAWDSSEHGKAADDEIGGLVSWYCGVNGPRNAISSCDGYSLDVAQRRLFGSILRRLRSRILSRVLRAAQRSVLGGVLSGVLSGIHRAALRGAEGCSLR